MLSPAYTEAGNHWGTSLYAALGIPTAYRMGSGGVSYARDQLAGSRNVRADECGVKARVTSLNLISPISTRAPATCPSHVWGLI